MIARDAHHAAEPFLRASRGLEPVTDTQAQTVHPERTTRIVGKKVVAQAPARCEPVLSGKHELSLPVVRGIETRHRAFEITA